MMAKFSYVLSISLCLSVCLFVCLSLSVPVCVCVCVSVSVCLSVYLSVSYQLHCLTFLLTQTDVSFTGLILHCVCLSVCSVSVFVCLSLFGFLSVSMPCVSLSVHLSIPNPCICWFVLSLSLGVFCVFYLPD